MKFTKLLESYKEKKMKFLSEMINEEPTEQEFNSEVETVKKQHMGKIRKKIADASKQAVECQKEETEIDEEARKVDIPAYIRKQRGDTPLKLDDLKRKDTMSDLQNLRRMKKEKLGEGLSLEEMRTSHQLDETLGKDASAKKWIDDFIKSDDPRFANDSKAKRIKRALGAYYAQHPEKSNVSEETEQLDEWNAQGHKASAGERWLKDLGFSKTTGGDHPKWTHFKTGKSVTGWNDHGKEIKSQDARSTRNQVKKHHEENGLPYRDLK